MTADLNTLLQTERRAWRKMMTGSEADARSVWGEEGVNYLAWCAAADAVRAYRAARGLLLAA